MREGPSPPRALSLLHEGRSYDEEWKRGGRQRLEVFGDKYIYYYLVREDSLQRPYESIPTVHLPSRVSEVSVGPLLGGHEVQRHQDRGGHLGTVSEECEHFILIMELSNGMINQTLGKALLQFTDSP